MHNYDVHYYLKIIWENKFFRTEIPLFLSSSKMITCNDLKYVIFQEPTKMHGMHK